MGAGGVGTCRWQGLVNISYGTDPCLEQADRSLDDPSCQGAGGQAGDGKEGEKPNEIFHGADVRERVWRSRNTGQGSTGAKHDPEARTNDDTLVVEIP